LIEQQNGNKIQTNPDITPFIMTNLLVTGIAFLDQVLGGSLGAAIVVLSLCIRLALLPLTIRLARRARRNQAVARSLQPEIEALRRRFEKKPERIFEETMKVYRRNNHSPFDVPAMLGGFLQVPVFGLLYKSIKRSLVSSRAFLWIRNLSAPDLFITLLILSLTAMTAYLAPSASEQMRSAMIVMQVVVTSLIVWKLAAGLGLYWVASSLVSLSQTLWLRRDSRAAAAQA
jgi:YidC/Oxa1 family membrane protein insertase